MGENIKIDEIVIHAKYRGEAHDNDYAIPPDNDYAMLKLTSSSSIKPTINGPPLSPSQASFVPSPSPVQIMLSVIQSLP
jgi:hypothetical protein